MEVEVEVEVEVVYMKVEVVASQAMGAVMSTGFTWH